MQNPNQCECTDPGCPVLHNVQCTYQATITLYRVDMTDETGTLMCDDCAEDAMECGLFTDSKDNESENAD